MECKSDLLKDFCKLHRELIDTLWNVNTDAPDASEVRMYELIDTLWNVNTNDRLLIFPPKRINRYIMECKLHLRH